MRPNNSSEADGRNYFVISEQEFRQAQMGHLLNGNDRAAKDLEASGYTESASRTTACTVLAGNIALYEHVQLLPVINTGNNLPADGTEEMKQQVVNAIASGMSALYGTAAEQRPVVVVR